MIRALYIIAGIASVGLGVLGAILPLLPATPFFLLAAFCFSKSSPRLERWILENKTFGPPIALWREKGAISRKGKNAATLAFIASAIIALIFVPLPWSLAAPAIGVIGGWWIWSRPEA